MCVCVGSRLGLFGVCVFYMCIYYIYRSPLSLLINMFAFWTDPAVYLPTDTYLLGFCAGVGSGQGLHRLCQLTPAWFLCRCGFWTGPS